DCYDKATMKSETRMPNTLTICIITISCCVVLVILTIAIICFCGKWTRNVSLCRCHQDHCNCCPLFNISCYSISCSSLPLPKKDPVWFFAMLCVEKGEQESRTNIALTVDREIQTDESGTSFGVTMNTGTYISMTCRPLLNQYLPNQPTNPTLMIDPMGIKRPEPQDQKTLEKGAESSLPVMTDEETYVPMCRSLLNQRLPDQSLTPTLAMDPLGIKRPTPQDQKTLEKEAESSLSVTMDKEIYVPMYKQPLPDQSQKSTFVIQQSTPTRKVRAEPFYVNTEKCDENMFKLRRLSSESSSES
ncbi:hypothetical protein BgiBS90_013236, partial [Biomphalaria glabrata]